MTRANRIWMASFCAVVFLPGAMHWFHARPIHAQQNEQSYDDGTFYIESYSDVDTNYNLYVDSYMEVEYDFDGDIDEIDVDGYADEDGSLIADGYSDGDDYSPAETGGNLGVVDTGHEYGIESDGFACFDDDGEGDFGDCDWEYVGTSYTSVNVYSPPPQIYSLSPSSVTQGDQGTLTITGSNFIENSTDQLTLNFSGPNNPFTLISAPLTCTTSCTATYSYDFTGYPPGTYQLSLTNNEVSSENYPFTVSQYTAQVLPPDACAVTSSPQVGFTSIVSTASSGGSGTVSVSFSGSAFSTLSPSVPYGPYSTPSSIASNLAALITKSYAQKGLFARAFGSNIIYGGVASLGAVNNVATGTSFTTDGSSTAASAAAAACYALPKPPCLGLFPDYDYTRTNPYADGSTTPRQHIINKHILGTPSAAPPNTIYVNPGGYSPDDMFTLVKAYNFVTVLLNPTPVNGAYKHTYTKTTQTTPTGTVEKGWIGIDASGNDLYTNTLYLSADRCRVNTSYPTAP